MDIQLKRGFLEICVLAAMLRGDTYGYKLIRDLPPGVDISESTLYPILKRLEAAACVAVRSDEHNGRLRKYYSITPAGRARIDDFALEWSSVERIHDFIVGELAATEGNREADKNE